MADAPPPQIVYPQNPIASPQVILNIVGAGVTWVVAHYGLASIWSSLDPQTQNGITTAIALAVMSLANIAGKMIFPHGPLSFAAPITGQPPAQNLPQGSSVVTVAHPEAQLAPSVVALPPGQQVVSVPILTAPPPPTTAPVPLIMPAAPPPAPLSPTVRPVQEP